MEKIVRAHIHQFTEPSERMGATYVPGQGVHIRLWAPKAKEAVIEWDHGDTMKLERSGEGYFTGLFADKQPGDRYSFKLDDGDRIADPASRFQPHDTSGTSEVTSHDFPWRDRDWRGVPFAQWVIYEIHTGTYSERHNFDGIIADLPRLQALGVTTLELMPVAQFSGDRNWGYDGVFPHAVQHSYGGPNKLKELVDACHAHGMAIILDCVFNHIGPEGNILFTCGPYVSGKYHTPWGAAMNFDGKDSDHVRRYFLQAAWQWLTEFHFDGLRLDAVQMIFDNSPVPFLQELAWLKREAELLRGHPLIITAESDMNDSRLLLPPESHGLGMDAHWADDFHHCLHVMLTGEKDGYYQDYGGIAQLARIYRHGVAFEGDYSPLRRRRHGRSYQGVDKKCLIVETQNHDQIGNRLRGERLISLIGMEKAKLAAACVLLSPFTPFLFMGEEFACDRPFQYFISHHGAELVEIVRKGRAEEWKDFDWKETPPDPAAIETFGICVLHGKNPVPGSDAAAMTEIYGRLIEFSKKIRQYGEADVEYDDSAQWLRLTYHEDAKAVYQAWLSFSGDEQTVLPTGAWQRVFATTGENNGHVEGALTLPPFSATLLQA